MPMLISMNGVRTPAEAAKLSIFDRGFLFGDAIYEVIATHHGRSPFHLDAHLDRLERSGAATGIDVPALRPALEGEISSLVADAPGSGELYIRIMITRGESPGLDLLAGAGPPTWIVMVKPLPAWERRHLETGVRLLSVRPEEIVGRVAPWVKSNNRQANVMAHSLARGRGYDDSLFVDPTGNVTEGPSWNVFCVEDGEVVTPPLERGLLPGITRGLIIGLCAELGIPCREALVSLEEARGADEVFLTSTTRGVMAVAELDARPYCGGQTPGPITRRLRDALLAEK